MPARQGNSCCKDGVLALYSRKDIGEHTVACEHAISMDYTDQSQELDLPNLAVSRIHLLNRMMLELRVIHVLVEVAISICAEATELVRMWAVLAGLVHNIEGWMYI